MGLLGAFSSKSANDLITASEWNANFSAIRTWANTYAVLKDTAGTISASHTFSGGATFSSGLTVSAGTLAAQALTATTGAFSSTLSAGATTLTSTLAVTGAATFAGAVTLGDATGDAITVTGRLASSLVPGTDNTYDLGTATLGYRTGYFATTLIIKAGTTSKLILGATDATSPSLAVGSTNLLTYNATTHRWYDVISTNLMVALNSSALTVSVATTALQALTATTGVFSGAVSSTDLTASGTVTCATLTVSNAPTFAGLTLTSTLSTNATGATNAIDYTGANPRIRLSSGGTLSWYSNAGVQLGFVGDNGDIRVGSSTTSQVANSGFLVIPSMTGFPAGTPTIPASMVMDRSNNKLYLWNGSAWKSVQLT